MVEFLEVKSLLLKYLVRNRSRTVNLLASLCPSNQKGCK